MNILNCFIFSQYKLHHRSSTGLVIYRPPENIEIFKVKLRRSKSSRLLQRIAFLVMISNRINKNLKEISWNNRISKTVLLHLCGKSRVIYSNRIKVNKILKEISWSTRISESVLLHLCG